MPLLTLHPNGDVDMNLQAIERIDLENLVAVTFLKKEKVNGITTIEINFAPDGSFLIQYDDAGKVVKFKGTNISFGVKDEKIVILKPHQGGPTRVQIGAAS
jgi:hypothetical protein